MYSRNYNMVVLGAKHVGKTTLVQSFTEAYGASDDRRTSSRLLVDPLNGVMPRDYVNKIHYKDEVFRLNICDIPGLEDGGSNRSIRLRSIRRAHACVLVYAVNDKDSLHKLQDVKNEVFHFCHQF